MFSEPGMRDACRGEDIANRREARVSATNSDISVSNQKEIDYGVGND
jgi:hypothetical protein